MPTMKRIEEFGYQASFFKFSSDHAARFEYYMFDTQVSLYADKWTLIAVHLQKQPFWLLELQLITIETDTPEAVKALQDEGYEAPRDAHDATLYLSSEMFPILVQFFEAFSSQWSEHMNNVFAHFHRLDKKEMADLHFPQALIEYGQGNYYRYLLEKSPQNNGEKISLIAFPKGRPGTLSFDTFGRDNLKNPSFRPFLSEWGGYMAFTKDAWQEFLLLLKLHAGERQE